MTSRVRIAVGYRPPHRGVYRAPIAVTGSAERVVDIRQPERRAKLLAEYRAARAGRAVLEPLAPDAETQADDAGLVAVPVRAISAVIVPGYWIDHTDVDVLKAAVPLFDRIPVYPNHCAMPTMWLGYCTEPRWSDVPMGTEKAPGVDVTAVIDAGSSMDAKRVAAGVLAQSLVRWSLGFDLDAEPSHPDLMDTGAFWNLLGGFDESGQMYRWVAKSIPDVYELSIVDVGAIESARTTDAPDPRLTKTERPDSRRFRSRGPVPRISLTPAHAGTGV